MENMENTLPRRTEKEVDQTIDGVSASMAAARLPLTEEDRRILKERMMSPDWPDRYQRVCALARKRLEQAG